MSKEKTSKDKENKEALTLGGVSESCWIKGKVICEFSDKLGFCPRCDTDAYSR